MRNSSMKETNGVLMPCLSHERAFVHCDDSFCPLRQIAKKLRVEWNYGVYADHEEVRTIVCVGRDGFGGGRIVTTRPQAAERYGSRMH